MRPFRFVDSVETDVAEEITGRATARGEAAAAVAASTKSAAITATSWAT